MIPEQIKATEVRRRDRVWAPDDGDWLLVDRIDRDGFGDVVFYRLDGSEASFSAGDNVLCERRHEDFPAGRRPAECPGACSCTRVCGQAVIDGLDVDLRNGA